MTNFAPQCISLLFFVFIVIFGQDAPAATLRVGIATPPSTEGDPFSRYSGGAIKSAVFDGLTQLSNTGEVRPAVASDWQQVSDNEWRFTLRSDVRFHNGRAVTAESVAQQFQYLMSEQAQFHWMAQQFKTVKSVNVVDSNKLIIVTNAPDPLIARKMSLLRVIDMDQWRELGEAGFADQPIGTGPYRVVTWGPNKTNVKLSAVNHAWRKRKNIDAIDYIVIPDGTSRLSSLLSGKTHLATNLEVDAVSTLEAGGFVAEAIEQPIVLALGFRTVKNENAAINDPRVRQALNYAVNKEHITRYILADKMTVASQGTTPGVLGFNADVKPYAYDPRKSRDLLSQAGYADGFDLKMSVWTGQVPGDALIFQQVAQDLSHVGVRVELRQLPFLEMNRRLAQGEWEDIDAIATVWSSLNLFDAGQALETFSCTRRPAAFFCDAELEAEIDRARAAKNIDQREQALQQAMSKAVSTASSIFLVSYTNIVGMSPKVRGYTQRSDGIPFEDISLESVP